MTEKTDIAAIASKMKDMEKEIDQLHNALQKKGVNSRGVTDIFGREFSVPVDQEHKCTQLVLFNFQNPHNRAFHTSWFGFFSSFFSMFASAPLMAYMKKKTSLNMVKSQIGEGNISAVSTNIVMRVVTGFLCDMLGPRRALSFLLLITCPPILGMYFVTDATGWIACRAFIGIGLATFVTSQVWCSQMFAKSVVGLVNATSAGWGNLGGGVTNLVMPYIFLGFYSAVEGTATEDKTASQDKEDKAWRLCFLIPLAMHFIGGLGALTGRDLPDGNIKELEASGAKQKSKGGIVLKTGLSNMNAWVLTITYGMCFGIELTMNSVAALYFYEYHGLTPQIAGLLASLYGLMNLFARSAGGLISDMANKSFGMRGRLWACWIVQTIEGAMCIFMALTTLDMDAPFERPDIVPYIKVDDTWLPCNHTDKIATEGGIMGVHDPANMYEPITISECGSDQAEPPVWFQTMYGVDDSLQMFLEPPFERGGAAADCISNQGAAGMSVFCMILFSLCVQAAEGLHYGIVPYVSRPALGIVSGMVGAGGNLGAVIALWSFFKGGEIRTDEGFFRLGFMVIGLTATMFFIYFPDMGGMLLPAGALGSYDPQLIKPPADYRGADSIDFSAAKKDQESKTADADAQVVSNA